MCRIKKSTYYLNESTCYLEEFILTIFINFVNNINLRNKIEIKKKTYKIKLTQKIIKNKI